MFCQYQENQKLQQKINKLDFVCVGLQNSGKSSLLQSITEEEQNQIYGTKGFNMKAFKYKKIKITICDCGGDKNFRTLWDYYYQNVNGIIYVIDTTNEQLMEEAGQEIINILNEPLLEKKPLLILSNKIDLENSWDLDQIINYFGIKDINDRAWAIFQTSCHQPDSIKKDFLMNHIEIMDDKYLFRRDSFNEQQRFFIEPEMYKKSYRNIEQRKEYVQVFQFGLFFSLIIAIIYDILIFMGVVEFTYYLKYQKTCKKKLEICAFTDILFLIAFQAFVIYTISILSSVKQKDETIQHINDKNLFCWSYWIFCWNQNQFLCLIHEKQSMFFYQFVRISSVFDRKKFIYYSMHKHY